MAERIAYKRILLKLSGEVLQGKNEGGIDFKILSELCAQIKEIKKMRVEVAIVIGGGNFWRFRDFKSSGLDRVKSDYMGMLATVMNSIALQEALKSAGLDAYALSAIDMPQVCKTYTVDRGLKYLKKGRVVICAAGTGSPFFTTDTTAALRGCELKCDVVLKATKVDYVYDKDPAKHKNAKSYKTLSYSEVLEKKLEVMDLSAISLCMENRLPIVVFNLKKEGNIKKVVKGENVGTKIN